MDNKITYLNYSQYKNTNFDGKVNKAEITDYALMQQGFCSIKKRKRSIFDKNPDIKRYGDFILYNKQGIEEGYVKSNGQYIESVYYGNDYRQHTGVRPAIIFSSPYKMYADELDNITYRDDGLIEVEYGYYPKNVVPISSINELNEELESGNLILTGNKYTDMTGNVFPEYEFEGNRYIQGKMHCFDSFTVLSNGETYYNGQNVWIKVEPLKWLLDEKAKIMITKDIIFSTPKHFGLNNFMQEIKQDLKTISFNDNTNTKLKDENISQDDYIDLIELKRQKNELKNQIIAMNKQIEAAKELLAKYEEMENKKVLE